MHTNMKENVFPHNTIFFFKLLKKNNNNEKNHNDPWSCFDFLF